jgi:hypothetical protein
MTTPSQPQPLRVYRVFGLLLVTALVLTSAGYVFFRVTPQERNVNVAGIIIPVPDGMKKVSETSVAANAPDQTHGKVAFKGKVSPSMIVRFYHNLMPAKDWQPDSILGAETGGYVFTRGNQKLIINVAEPEPDTSILTIVVNSGEPPIMTG